MEPATLVTIALVAIALLGIWLLPLRKPWNEDGSADRARARAVERDEANGTDDAGPRADRAGP